jgi:UDP-N-acetylglucosamine--N-acetylmuramyl-(pentapeptide) pyrophosphoryl-undecaprenol N-acetylglucosamine transferase
VANCAQRLLQDPQLYLLQVAGERYFNMVSEWRETSNRADHRWQVIRFMYDMPHALAAADLVISRAGASTMEEIAACGVPAIFIPSPNVTDNHQEHNANALARQGAALVIREQMLSADNLAANIEDILGDKTRWNQMAAASKAASHPGATLRLGQLVLALARG